MDKFVFKLIHDGKIKCNGGNFFTFGYQNNLFSLTNITLFFTILKQIHGNKAVNIVKELGKRQVKAMIEAWFPNAKIGQKEIQAILAYLGLYCYGLFKVRSINNSLKQVIFELDNSPVCRMHIKLFGFSDCRVNYFMEGICAGIAEKIFDCEMDAIETDCIISHKGKCYIIAKKSDNTMHNIVLSRYDSGILLSDFRLPEIPQTCAKLINKVEGHHMMEWQNGMFTIWNCGAFTLPSVSVAFLIRACEDSFGDNVNSLMYHLARVQSRESVAFQVRLYGFKKDINLMMSIFQHMELTGFGVGTVEKLDLANKNAVFVGKYNPVPLMHKILFNLNKPMDHYLLGLISGMCEAFFGERVSASEESCTAEGCQDCRFEVGRFVNEARYPLESEYLKLIDDKINVKNFIL